MYTHVYKSKLNYHTSGLKRYASCQDMFIEINEASFKINKSCEVHNENDDNFCH